MKSIFHHFVLLLTLMLFGFVVTACDDDDDDVSAIEQAIGKWFSDDITDTWLEITNDKMSVWEQEAGETCVEHVFTSTYSVTGDSIKIDEEIDGEDVTVAFSVDGTTMTIVAPDGEGGTNTIVFTKTNFDPSSFKLCTNQDVIGKWISDTDTTDTWVEITNDSITVWEREAVENCTELEFKSSYTATDTSLIIANNGDGPQVVKYSISVDTMRVEVQEEGGVIIMNFVRDYFDPSSFIICLDLEGTWKNMDDPSEYLEVVNHDTYELWSTSDGTCYNRDDRDSYTFDHQTKTGIAQIGDADSGEGTITYDENNHTITVRYSRTSIVTSGLEVVKEVVITYEKVTDIDFEANQCN